MSFVDSIKITQDLALIAPNGPKVSYQSLAQNVARLQQIFGLQKLGLSLPKEQSCLAICIPNSLEFTITFLAITTMGHIAAPLNFNYKKSEFDFYLSDVDVKVIFVPKGFCANSELPIVQSAISNNAFLIETWFDRESSSIEFDIFKCTQLKSSVFASSSLTSAQNDACYTKMPGCAHADHTALILHTSGTTGRPKAVPLTHGNITRSMQIISNTYALTSKDRTYVVMPLFHVHGLIGALLSTLSSGGCAIIAPKFSAHNFWKDFVSNGATWYTAVPTIHQILLKTPKPNPMPKIRFIRSCSSALAPANLAKLENEFGAPVIEAMGMTECAHCVTSNNLPQFGARKPGTVGQAHGVEIVIMNDQGTKILGPGQVGEVCIKGSNITKGYLNNEKANKENFTVDGYFRTGDQGFFDPDNFLKLTGRIKELINRGGEKISPIELDNVMLSHSKVAEAVAFGVDDDKYGQVVHAAVVLNKGQTLSSQELAHYMGTKVSEFKIPVKFYFVNQLPKTATGKIQRRTLPSVFVKKAKL